jgi:ABC-2 type transport system permease protein
MLAAQGESMETLEAGAQIFFGLGILAIAVDVIILTQDTVIGERQSGIAEWVLSKPVSRSSYVLAKLAANGIGILVTLILLPGAVAYGLFWLATGGMVSLPRFAAGLGLMALHTAFYLALTIMMGVVAKSRGMVLGVTLGSLLGGTLLTNLLGPAAFITPWPLANIAVGVVQGAPLPTIALLPVALTAILTIVAGLAAVWAFERAEL